MKVYETICVVISVGSAGYVFGTLLGMLIHG